jgi:DNA modification methylase
MKVTEMTAKKKPVDNSPERTPEPAGARRAGAGRPSPPPKLTPRAREAADGEAMAARFPRYRMVKTDELRGYENNPRTHSDSQISKIVRSIREFGFTNPILTDGDAGVIAGHGRLMAAQQLGLETVPTIELKHLTAAQRRAYVIADNRLAEDAGWDDDLLRLELGDLRDMGFDLDLTGFDPLEVDKLFGPAGGNTDPDDVPEVQAEAVTVLGDVWLLGRHRLVCGDATSAPCVEKTLADVKPHLMVTDPPYGVEYLAGWRDDVLGGKSGGRATGAVANDGRSDWSDAWVLFPGDVAYVWHNWLQGGPVADNLRLAGLEVRTHLVWVKSRFVLSRGHYHSQHECCWYAVRKGANGHWSGDHKQTTTWNIEHNTSETGHSTQKPVECMRRPIENNSSPGQAVYDPFVGSGTTIIAAEMTGRVCHAIEISPQYVDVAIRRWMAFAGAEATLESDGRTFAEVERARLAVTA